MREIDHRLYLNAHGKKPKGTGLWVFGEYPGPINDHLCFRGSYDEASRAALAKFPPDVHIYVMP